MSSTAEKTRLSGWTMVLGATVLILVFSYIPMFQAFVLSLKTGKGLSLRFSGAANYLRLFQDKTFWTTLGNTLFYAVASIPLMLLLALIIAVLLNDPSVPFRGLFRTCIFLPCVTSLVSYAILFRSLFSVDGVVNKILLLSGLVDSPIPFILDPLWAKVVVVLALLWRYTGYYMIFYLAALQNINPSLYEAARMDGCTPTQSFFRITIPMLRQIVFLTGIMALNSTLQIFDEVVNLTNGGPGNATRTVSQYIYDLSFVYVPSYGYASAVSYVVLAIVLALTLFQKSVAGRNDA